MIRFANKIMESGGSASVKSWILDDYGYDLVLQIHSKNW